MSLVFGAMPFLDIDIYVKRGQVSGLHSQFGVKDVAVLLE
jgi:hypothetical protein